MCVYLYIHLYIYIYVCIYIHMFIQTHMVGRPVGTWPDYKGNKSNRTDFGANCLGRQEAL